MDKQGASHRSFVKGTRLATLAAGTSLGGGLAGRVLAAIDPNSHPNRFFHASHYGPLEGMVRDGRPVGVSSVAEIDARPTEMLSYGIVDRTYDRTRILQPMVRKSYLENWDKEDGKVEMRGREPFVPVDRDTALKLANKAILDTIDKYGNEGLFSASYGGWSHAGLLRPHVLQGRFFNLIGGSTLTIQDYSAGASEICLPCVIGDMEVLSAQTAWERIRDNTEVFFLVGCDPMKNNRIEFTVADHQMYAHWEKFRDAGIRFISINPQYTATDEVLGSEWVDIVPNTDVALFLAMSHHVLANGRQDDDFLKKYTVGSDVFIAYVMGEDGGGPKTPGWAAKITGIEEDKIVELAELAINKRCEFAGGWSLQRAQHGEMTHWAMINFACLLGKIGLPGQGVGFSWHYGSGGMPQSGKSVPSGLSQGRNLVKTYCPASRISEMLLNPGREFVHNGETRTFPRVKLLWSAGNNFMSHQQDTNELIRALRVLDTVIVQDPWWCASTRWADIVLAPNTTVERDDISSGGTYSVDKAYAMKKIIEPVGESLDDYEIFRRLAELLGQETQFTEDKTVMDHLKLAYERSSAEMSFEEFWEKGYVRLEVPPEAGKWVRHGAFCEDPEKNPLHTASGKIEMYCATIAAFGIEDCPGMPMYMEPAEFLGNAMAEQVHVVSPHPWYRLHSQMANSERLRTLYKVQGREPILINPEDALERNIEDGDLVEVYNDRGAVVVGAVVSDRIRKGVVSLYEGAWPQVDSKGRCNSGLINFLTSSRRSSGLSQATSANTCLAYMKKCEDPDGPNQAYEPPKIEPARTDIALDDEKLNLERIYDITEKLMANMTPGEKLFYERCTVCHGPRDPLQYTQLQWKGITKSMFPRAGLEPNEQEMVLEFLNANAEDAALSPR
ncbi:MAG: molybdopterin-dependent oxidoreductase [Geminicoccaceae bacterium]|nr:molybdopterin-dependent oxidoreductase [Geminicoccaceae bacterium]